MLRTAILRMLQAILVLLITIAIIAPFAFIILDLSVNQDEIGMVFWRLLILGNLMVGFGFWTAGRFNDGRRRIESAIRNPPMSLKGPATPERLAQVAGSKPLFVYLRAFRGDGSVHTAAVEPQRSSMQFAEMFAPVKTYEMLLASLYREDGELLAIGRPGELLPPVGFRRVYVDDGSWRDWVDSLLSMAAGVIVEIGRSKNLQWELELALGTVPTERLTLFLHDRTAPDAMAATIALLRAAALPRPGPRFLYIDREGGHHVDRDIDVAVRRAFRLSIPALLDRAARIQACAECDYVITEHARQHLGRTLCSVCYYHATLDSR
jgi:hypothetical protein